MSADDLLEKEIEQPAMEYAESRGWWQDKIMRTSRGSFPDRYLVRNGRTILIEFKAPGEPPRPKQAKRHRELRAHGAEVFVVDNLEDAKEILR